jgi:hypothetical protein
MLDGSTPLRWTAIAVRVLLVLFAIVMIWEIGRAVLTGGANASKGTTSRSVVCVAAPGMTEVQGNFLQDPERANAITAEGLARERAAIGDTYYYPVEAGVEFAYDLPEICVEDSSLAIQALYQASRFATGLVVFAAIFLLERLIRGARRDSGFNEVVVNRLRFLGMFLGAGTLAASLFTTIAETGLAGSMVGGALNGFWEMAWRNWDFPWAYLIAGLGFVAMAKIVRVGAHMREELQGTV